MQAVQPGGTRQINTFSEAVTVDFERNAVRIALDGQRAYPAPGRLAFTDIIDGQNGALEQADAAGGTSSGPFNPSRHATRLRDVNRMPIRVLATASESAALDRLPDRRLTA